MAEARIGVEGDVLADAEGCLPAEEVVGVVHLVVSFPLQEVHRYCEVQRGRNLVVGFEVDPVGFPCADVDLPGFDGFGVVDLFDGSGHVLDDAFPVRGDVALEAGEVDGLVQGDVF